MIGRVLGELGTGVFEIASDMQPEDRELAWMERLSAETGQPVSFGLLQQDLDPSQWRRLLDAVDRAWARGTRLTAQVAARPTSLLLGLQSSAHPFLARTAYQAIKSGAVTFEDGEATGTLPGKVIRGRQQRPA